MTLTKIRMQADNMASDEDLGTKTVRLSGASVTKLKTIDALLGEMGEKFKQVEFLNGLTEKPIAELHAAVKKRYEEYEAKRKKNGHKKP